jgi:hypothetical protein
MYDRVGAEAIVRSLVDAGAVGLITTHDLSLTEKHNFSVTNRPQARIL